MHFGYGDAISTIGKLILSHTFETVFYVDMFSTYDGPGRSDDFGRGHGSSIGTSRNVAQ